MLKHVSHQGRAEVIVPHIYRVVTTLRRKRRKKKTTATVKTELKCADET